MPSFAAILAGAILSLPVSLFALTWVLTRRHRPRKSTDDEAFFSHPGTDRKAPFPSVLDAASVYLSVVVPAYNEQDRLPTMLDQALVHLERRRRTDRSGKFTYEIIIVDDGSRDKTAEIALDYMRKTFKSTDGAVEIRLLKLSQNRGKGGAVTQGVLRARGDLILMVDADGATQFSDLDLLEERCIAAAQNDISVGKKSTLTIADKTNIVVIGSRAHLVATDAVVKRSLIRNILMRGFHFIVYLLSSPEIRRIGDTQCGFKLFSRAAAQKIFPRMHVEGWIFDIEILHLATRFGIQIDEIQVNWHEVDGSKISLLRDAIKMALDLFTIRFAYLFSFWT